MEAAVGALLRQRRPAAGEQAQLIEPEADAHFERLVFRGQQRPREPVQQNFGRGEFAFQIRFPRESHVPLPGTSIDGPSPGAHP